MSNLGNFGGFHMKGLGPDMVAAFARVDIGATGAPTLTGHPGLSIVRTDTGDYTVTAPAVPKAKKGVLFLVIAKSTTIFNVVGITESPTTGTWTFTCYNSGTTVTDPASGDVLYLVYLGEASSA
jgi:hypothetical protein